MGTFSLPPLPCQHKPARTLIDVKRLTALYNNDLDLSVELRDLAAEIDWRVTRIAEVLELRRQNRRELDALTAVTDEADA